MKNRDMEPDSAEGLLAAAVHAEERGDAYREKENEEKAELCFVAAIDLRIGAAILAKLEEICETLQGRPAVTNVTNQRDDAEPLG
jgi:hypothetical protein